jgi:hypothetical protein
VVNSKENPNENGNEADVHIIEDESANENEVEIIEEDE